LVASSEIRGTFSLNLYQPNGRRAEWHRDVSGSFISMIAGDVDGNGLREIIVAYGHTNNVLIDVISPSDKPPPAGRSACRILYPKCWWPIWTGMG
jgi:hypothetical protein